MGAGTFDFIHSGSVRTFKGGERVRLDIDGGFVVPCHWLLAQMILDNVIIDSEEALLLSNTLIGRFILDISIAKPELLADAFKARCFPDLAFVRDGKVTNYVFDPNQDNDEAAVSLCVKGVEVNFIAFPSFYDIQLEMDTNQFSVSSKYGWKTELDDNLAMLRSLQGVRLPLKGLTPLHPQGNGGGSKPKRGKSTGVKR